jgi:hypothetical protein
MRQHLVVRKRFMAAWLVALAGLAVAIGAATAIADGGNSENAHACQQDGWVNLVRSDGTAFSNQGDCVSYGAQGGSLFAVYHFTTELSGANENPVVDTPGTGTGAVTWNTATDQMTVDIVFGGLSSGTTASHIHCCAVPPTNAGVATTVPRFVGFPTGVTSGTYLQTLVMTDAGSYNPAFVTSHGGTLASAEAALLTGLLAGQAYLNVHTSAHMGGEIRGVLLQAS